MFVIITHILINLCSVIRSYSTFHRTLIPYNTLGFCIISGTAVRVRFFWSLDIGSGVGSRESGGREGPVEVSKILYTVHIPAHQQTFKVQNAHVVLHTHGVTMHHCCNITLTLTVASNVIQLIVINQRFNSKTESSCSAQLLFSPLSALHSHIPLLQQEVLESP